MSVFNDIWKAGIGLVVGLIYYAVKDYRKSKIENRLAEETLAPKAGKISIDALESQLLVMSKAWELERDSNRRVIDGLEEELNENQEELRHCKAEARFSREEVSALRLEVAQLRADLIAIQGGRK